MIRLVAILWLTVLPGIGAGCWAAAELDGLYEAEVPVSGQNRTERQTAIRQGLAQVLIKVTGRPDVAAQPQSEALLARADELVQQFQYLLGEGALGTTKQRLWVRFDGEAIKRALYKADLPVWGTTRPTTLIWLAVEREGERFLVGGDNAPGLQQVLTRRARQRGVPLLLPLMDLKDQGAIQFADVWGNFDDAIAEASQRYDSEAILVGRVRHSGDQWQGRWTLYEGRETLHWQTRAAMLDDVLRGGVNGVATRLAERFALNLGATAETTLNLVVEAVHGVSDYARVTDYLQALPPVTRLEVARVEGEKVGFRLQTRGDRGALERSIALGDVLAPPSGGRQPLAGGEQVTADGQLRYRLSP